MGFSTERSDDWWWLMTSVDVNANRLLLATLDDPAGRSTCGPPRARRPGPPAARPLGHDDGQRLGHRGAEAFLANLRARAGDGQCESRAAGGTGEGRQLDRPVPATVLQAWPQGRGT
jgi:hypothetical protein